MADLRMTARHRNPTEMANSLGARREKALAIKKSRSGLNGQLTKNYKELYDLMNDPRNSGSVLDLKGTIDELYNRMLDCHSEYIKFLDSEEDLTEAEHFLKIQQELKSERDEDIRHWFDGLSSVAEQALSIYAGDSVSVVSSSKSKLKLQAKAKQALAALKLKQLEQEQALESEIDETKIMFRMEEEKRMNEMKRKYEHLKAKHEFDRAVTELHIYEEEEVAQGQTGHESQENNGIKLTPTLGRRRPQPPITYAHTPTNPFLSDWSIEAEPTQTPTNPFLPDWSREEEPVHPAFKPYMSNSSDFVRHSVPDNRTYVLKSPLSFTQHSTNQTTSTVESFHQGSVLTTSPLGPPHFHSTQLPSSSEPPPRHLVQTPCVKHAHIQQLSSKPESTPLPPTSITRESKPSQQSTDLGSQENLHQQQYSNEGVDGLPSSPQPPTPPEDDHIQDLPTQDSLKPKTEPKTEIQEPKTEMKKEIHQEPEIEKNEKKMYEELRDQQRTLINTMTNVMMLPKPELLTFTGDPLEYWRFIRNFEQNIVTKTTENNERLNYLLQYCGGKAKEVIKSCVVMDPNLGYSTARKLLYERFGEPYTIATAYIKLVTEGPMLRPNDREGLQEFSDKLKDCELTLKAIGYLEDLNSADNLKKIAERFPVHAKAKWLETAMTIREKGERPKITDMSNFLSRRAKAANDPVFGSIIDSKNRNEKTQNFQPSLQPRRRNVNNVTSATTLALQTGVASQETKLFKCPVCANSHTLPDCKEFQKKPYDDRVKLVRQKGRCNNCLKGRHIAKFCYQKPACEVKGCTGKHHTLLHPPSSPQDKDKKENSSKGADTSRPNSSAGAMPVQASHCNAVNANQQKVCLPIVPVRVSGKKGGPVVETYALLDQGSDVTLCDKGLAKQLEVTGKERVFTLNTVESTNNLRKGLEVCLDVMSMDSDETIELLKVLTVDKLPISLQGKPSSEDMRKWPHLDGIMIPTAQSDKVTLLIGNDVPEVFWTIDERRGDKKEPYAVKSLLGWTVVGPVSNLNQDESFNVNTMCLEDDILQQQLQQFWKTDFIETSNDRDEVMSVDDRKALKVLEDSAKLVDGHLQLALPWKFEEPCLPNNRIVAESRLKLLKKRFERDSVLFEKYKGVIDDYLAKGYARRVPDDLLQPEDKVLWYLPHHPVVNPKKPKKLRVVFDCAAKFKNSSLNSQLLQGPDLTNSLVGVLTRFRQEPVALTADIEAMFLQVKVDPKDIDVLRFLWWPNGDLNEEPTEYQMLVHIFGATSSPTCANFSLNKVADDHQDQFNSEAIKTVKSNFYVDDCLKSCETEAEAKELAKDLKALLSKGGFNLTKWTSNSREVIDAIPEADRSVAMKSLDLEESTVERTLGVHWDVTRDEFGFEIATKDKPATRRGLLSIISSVYDPLGIASPFVLSAKLILQDLCRLQLRWDDTIPDSHLSSWNKWLLELPKLSSLTIPRCLKPLHFGKELLYQLHHFSDASQSAYGAVTYIRITNHEGEHHCSFVIGKSRLAPIKSVSIPRLELSAAVVATRLDKMMRDEIDLPLAESVFWTDSTTVLQYINNHSKRFSVFVGNRVSAIHELTDPSQWRYVSSKDNPADDASRGLSADKLTRDGDNRWINGPTFLWKSEDFWPAPILHLPEISADDPEVKREKQIFKVTSEGAEDPLKRLYSRHSSWYRLKVSVAWLLRFKKYLVDKYRRARNSSNSVEVHKGELSVKEIHEAECEIIKNIQNEAFKTEIFALRKQAVSGKEGSVSKGRQLPKSSRIENLCPFLKEGVLCVGGRLDYAPISEDAKHPPILPKNHPVSELIVRHYHLTYGHVGREHVLSLVRQSYWIVGARVTVRRVLKSCFECRKRKAPPCTQFMAELPKARLTPDKPPFSFVGTDFFGPFFVKRGRRVEKRYGCIFTCLTSRAVHIEVTHSLEADSFLNALIRFINRRGKPIEIRSDNGTNYKGGEKELRESIREWNQQKIESFLKQREIVWKFNPPAASNMGGVWERVIRSVRSILSAMLKEQTTTDEALLTFFSQVEAILNSRPLTTNSDDPKDDTPLTPNHILLLRAEASLPPGVFKPNDQYSRRRWRQCQYLANVFWARWLREYLPTLQQRQKWSLPTRNLKKGDVVLIKDEAVKRGQWPLARVIEVVTARDGYVRSAKVKTSSTILTRPVNKLCLLEEAM